MTKSRVAVANIPFIGALITLVALIAAGELITTSIVKDRLLTDEAKQASADWLNGLTSYIPELRYALAKKELAVHTAFQLSRSGTDGPIFRYKLYDTDSVPLFDSTQHYLSFDPSKVPHKSGQILDEILAGREIVQFYKGEEPNFPPVYSRAFLPVTLAGKAVGVLEIYLDQTQSSVALDNAFRIVAVVTAILLAISVLLLGSILYLRRREQLQTETALKRAHSYDKLTGLANREEFVGKLKEMISKNAKSSDCIVTLCLDLDGFKKLNDALGYEIGDQVLLHASRVCTDCVREGDIVARIGDDKFAIAMSRNFGSNGIHDIANRLNAMMAKPLTFEGKTIHLTTSIGIGFAEPDEANPLVILKNAEVALHWSKAEGGGGTRVFQQSMDKTLHERMNLETELRHAVMNEEMTLFYQPQIDMKSGRVIGCEALMRWDHPKRGMISPEIFITLAEETGLIHRMGEWAVQRACQDAQRWPAPINIAVNLSPKQIEAGNMEAIIRESLRITGLPASRLELEVTENVLIKDPERAIETLSSLHEMGISIALDDFGTGYSSLAYLSRFPFNKIKIDRSFIQELENDPHALPIVHTIIGLGQSLGSKVIAEGVETKQHAAILVEAGCNLAQGFFYARPMPHPQLIQFLATKGQAIFGETETMVA